MNTNQLKYFVAVAEYRSFTKAANQYYISQTAITQQIHALEESMNVQLFNRSSRPVALTPAGRIFFLEAKAILERMETAVSKVKDASTGLVGTLRIGYTKGYERSDLSNIPTFFLLAIAVIPTGWRQACLTMNMTSSSPGTAPIFCKNMPSAIRSSSAPLWWWPSTADIPSPSALPLTAGN